jgi:hypothetical protein
MIQGGHGGQQPAHFGSREHNGQFELGIGADQRQFVRPNPFERLFPEQLEGADGLGAGLAGDPLFRLEMEAILAEVLGRKQVGRLAVILADLPDAGVIGLLGARADGQQLQVIGEGIQDCVGRTFFICIMMSVDLFVDRGAGPFAGPRSASVGEKPAKANERV